MLKIDILEQNINSTLENKQDEDIINTLYFLKESVKNLKEISEEYNITFEQLKKASIKQKEEEIKISDKIKEIKVSIKEEDIISTLILLSKIFAEIEKTLDDTDFEMNMIYKSLKYQKEDNEKEKTATKKQKTQVKSEKEVETETKTKVEEKEEPSNSNEQSSQKEEEIETEELVF